MLRMMMLMRMKMRKRSPFGLNKRDGWVDSIGVRGGLEVGQLYNGGPKLYKMEVPDLP